MYYADYVTRARETVHKNQLWRLGLGLCVIALVLFLVVASLAFVGSRVLPADVYLYYLRCIGAGATPIGDLLMLYLLGGMGLGTLCAAWVLHGRGLASLVGPFDRVGPQFLRVLVYVLVLQSVVGLMFWPWGPEPNVALGAWLGLLPLTILGLFLQTGSEEILFRGYIQSQLAARFNSPIVWMVLPSVVFGALHFDPATFGSNAIYIAALAAAFGVAVADITARAGTLGPALAMHFVNNFIAIGILSLTSEMSQLALFQLPGEQMGEAEIRSLLPLDLLGTFLSWLVMRIAIRA